MFVRTLLLALLLALAAPGCRAFTGHPVRLSQPRLAPGAETSAGALPEPAEPTVEELEQQLFLGVERLHTNLLALRGRTGSNPDPRKPSMAVLPSIEKSVRERFGGKTPDGPLRNAIAVGVLGNVPLPPAQMADLIMDPAVEKQVLAAAVCRIYGTDFKLPGMRRVRVYLEMLRMGFGPMRYDLRFAVLFERRDLSDGRILLRYDLAGDPKPQHVTLYRGGCIIEPTEGGSRVTEIVILGTDIKVPVFFAKGLRNLVQTTLRNRATNLWLRAWQGR